jgi:hypothetical protein
MVNKIFISNFNTSARVVTKQFNAVITTSAPSPEKQEKVSLTTN